MTKTIADALIEEGEQKGKKEGREEGKVEGVRDSLRTVLKARFPEAPREMSDRIETITDLEQLRGLLSKALAVNTLDELQL